MPRATPLLDLRDAIATVWTALTPPAYSPAKYRHVDKVDDGVSAHRQFWFRVSRGDALTEQGKGRFMLRHEFQAVMSLHTPERTRLEFDAAYEEAMTLISAVNTMAMPTSVHVARAMGYYVEQYQTDDGADLDLVINIEARTKESNP